jgi:hypothetical protein
VYRPVGYSFPLSRGRDGFEIRSNGEFVLFGMGPTDRVESFIGHWESTGNHEMRVTFVGGKIKPRVLHINSVTENVLRLGRTTQ